MKVNGFPSRPLEGYETDVISELCGGSPPSKPRGIHDFFRLVAEPVMRPGRLKFVLPLLGDKSVKALEADPRRGNRAFMTGSYFYAGVFATANQASRIPCRVEAARDLIGQRHQIFDKDAPPDFEDYLLTQVVTQRVTLEARSFCEFMEKSRKGLETEDDLLHQLATVGAGVVHVLATDSIRITPPDAEDLDSAHPELDDLSDAFDAIMCEFTENPPTF